MQQRSLKRRLFQLSFLLLFVLAPILDIFRLDLNLGHFILFGQDWKLNLTEFTQLSSGALVMRVLWVALLPIIFTVVLFLLIAWRWGRLYCGWLCPHFLAVETINNLMKRASGKLSFWDKAPIPEQQQDGTQYKRNSWWWIPTVLAIVGFAFFWALIAITYLLPPKEIYTGLITFSLSRYEMIFLIAVTFAFTIEFTLARHLFCRFACAVGVFQSLVWMGNKKGMVVGYNATHAKDCKSCDKSCEHACPMRLKPRTIKRKMFTCTQCFACVDSCTQVQAQYDKKPLLKMLINDCALDKSQRDFGRKAEIPLHCFEDED
ncbi:MAG: 4Fe-4S binding protein [Marinicella sp.]|nr:4Fe-4S binding protein [Xanthomonadales bacterium]